MGKKTLTWVLTVALLLGTVSGMALATAAEDPAFAYGSYISGEPMQIHAVQSFSVPFTEIAPRHAAYLDTQNRQLGLDVSAEAGLESAVTVEIKFQGFAANKGNTRLGMRYSTDPDGANSGYRSLVLQGEKDAESVSVNASEVQLEDPGWSISAPDADGWRVLTLPLTNADFSAGGIFHVVKWGNADGGSDGQDGWFIQSVLLYDTARGRPSEEDLYIRENTYGVLDFTGDEVEKELLTYTGDGNCSIVEYDGQNALKIAGGDGFHLTVSADDVDQPAVKATDEKVTFLIEMSYKTDNWNNRFYLQDTQNSSAICGWGHGWNVENGRIGYPENTDEWFVLRWDLTDNDTTEFKFGSWISSDTAAYIRKIVICRTEIVNEAAYDNAFVNFDMLFARYGDFQDVLTDSYKISWSVSELNEGDSYTIGEVQGKNAITAPSGYLYLNVDDAFTQHEGANVADLAVTVTYMDQEGNFQLHYNCLTPENYEDMTDQQKLPYIYAGVDLPMTGSERWKTVTLYLSNAQLRNEQNGHNDMRLPLFGGRIISSVEITVGADKSVLRDMLNRPVNTALYSQESLAVFYAARDAAQAVAEDKYATKAQVEAAIADLQAAIDTLEEIFDPRFTMEGASWDIYSSDGELDVFDGWNVFKMTSGGNKWIGIGDPEGILKDSASVTYEYEVYFNCVDSGSRCFLAFGDVNGFHEVFEAAPKFDEDGYWITGTGFAVHGRWGKVPSPETWGTISIKNDHYDPARTKEGCITRLGVWMEGTDILYLRSIKVYDSNDPAKYIQLRFTENKDDLLLTGGDGVELAEKQGEQAWVIPSGWKALNIDVDQLLADGTIQTDTRNFAVKINYWLEETDNVNELLMIKHYNPNGNGDNEDKTQVCEHQLNHSQLTKRGWWYQHTFLLTDGLFDTENRFLNITYGNGEAIYIRGVEVYECDENGEMISERPARWGTIVPEGQIEFSNPGYDWETNTKFRMTVRFAEGSKPTVFREDNGRKCAIIDDDYLYVSVDDEYLTPEDHFVRIDITHENGSIFYAQYNMIVPDGVDTSSEPNLSYYNFHSSHGLHEIVDGTNVNQATNEYTNRLGVVRPVNDTNNDWMVTSIYLNDASFRNAANGDDFRLHTGGKAAISRIEVVKITEEEYNAAQTALGDTSALKDLIAQIEELYPDVQEIPDEIWEVYEEAVKFVKDFGYRADQAAVDAMTGALAAVMPDAAVLGDADGDGEVTSTDARLTLQLAVHKIKETDIAHSDMLDVDGDGEITSTDARLILQYCIHKIPQFPVEL